MSLDLKLHLRICQESTTATDKQMLRWRHDEQRRRSLTRAEASRSPAFVFVRNEVGCVPKNVCERKAKAFGAEKKTYKRKFRKLLHVFYHCNYYHSCFTFDVCSHNESQFNMRKERDHYVLGGVLRPQTSPQKEHKGRPYLVL